MISDFSLKGRLNVRDDNLVLIKEPYYEAKTIELLRQAIVEIIKEETVPYDSTKPDKKQLELKKLRDKLCRRLNKAFAKDCRYCDICGGEIRETKYMMDVEDKEIEIDGKKVKLPKMENWNCINCGQMWDKDFKKLSIKIAWL